MAETFVCPMLMTDLLHLVVAVAVMVVAMGMVVFQTAVEVVVVVVVGDASSKLMCFLVMLNSCV